MTKADRIRALLKAGLSPREIAGEVGCPPVYVYTVRDRTGEDGKPIQRPADKGCQARRTRRYREEMVVDIIGGNCPVQAEGTVDGKPFYFRARGNKWSMGIGDDPVGIPHPHKIVDGKLVNPYPNEWYAECTWGKWPDAGWMPEEEARRLIEWCAGEYARTHQISPPAASDPSQGSDTTQTKNAAPEPILGRPGASDGEGTP